MHWDFSQGIAAFLSRRSPLLLKKLGTPLTWLHAMCFFFRRARNTLQSGRGGHSELCLYLTIFPVPAQAAAANLGCPDVDAVAQVAGQAAAVLAEALAPAALHELQQLRSLLQVGCQMCRSSCSAPLSISVPCSAWQSIPPGSLHMLVERAFHALCFAPAAVPHQHTVDGAKSLSRLSSAPHAACL